VSTSRFYREAWLTLAREGGWMKARDIVDLLPSGLELDDYHTRLWCMAKRQGYLASRGSQKQTEYAVTSDCIAPSGLTVRQISDALRVDA
jgi:hypothetical protein